MKPNQQKNQRKNSKHQQGGIYDLCQAIDPNRFQFLNCTANQGKISSNTDHQMIINMSFVMPVRPLILQMETPKNEKAPRVIRLFPNQGNMNFDDCKEVTKFQEMELPMGGKQEFLNSNLFKSVKSMTIFVKDNHGDQFTEIVKFRIGGFPIGEIDLKNLKQLPEGYGWRPDF